ncbi:MAG: putative selenate ABC transporter substrate-binding protein [Synechococcus sp.]|nr:putative selenate ABC transporter substrate-binding protein [Synechococcus sp.]
MSARERRAVVSLALLCSLATTALPSWAVETLRIGAIPDQNPEKLNRLYGLLAKELSKSLNVPVRYVPVSNYTAAVSAFRTGSLDLVWFGGLSGVQARLQTPGAQVIAQRDVDAKFRSVFIANSSSGLQPISSIQGLKALIGKRFTFGDPSSTSGRLMPQYFLQQGGVRPSQFAGGKPGFSGNHDATIALVQSGSYQAGALNEQVWASNVRAGKVDPKKVSVIWRTPTYVDYHWVARPGLDKRWGAGFTTKLKRAILGIQPTGNGKTILSLFNAGRFIPASAAQYRSIETIGRQLGKIR